MKTRPTRWNSERPRLPLRTVRLTSVLLTSVQLAAQPSDTLRTRVIPDGLWIITRVTFKDNPSVGVRADSAWLSSSTTPVPVAVFCTAPEVRSTPANFACEVIGTAMLLFGILAIGANSGVIQSASEVDMSALFSTGINPLLVGFLVWAIGLSLGGPTGYAINPARDLGPRIAHAILPIPGKGPSDWGYSWIPVAGPLVGGVIGALLFQFGEKIIG